MARGLRTLVAALVCSACLGGCIFVSEKNTSYERIEEKKAEAQYLAARAELERINLERQKAGLAPIEIPPRMEDTRKDP